jgi:hypothetical protein
VGKAVVPILIGAVVIGAAFLTGGASLIPTLTVGAAPELGLAATTFAGGLATTALGSIALAIGAGAVLSGVSQAFAKTPTVSQSTISRLQASLVPTAPRAMWFGNTAGATDIRYVEPSGTNQEYIDYILAVGSHKATSIDEIWFEDALAWTSGGGAQGIYVGYLTITAILEGSSSAYHTVNAGYNWGSAQRLTGCASIHIRIKRSGSASPFASGLPGRVTVRGKGIPLYDPRRDSTVAGGSGTMRANDQTTWAYAPGGTEIGQNLALQSLTYLLGWKIGGKVAVGRGVPPARLNLAAWITAANLCDETVTTASGTQPRYHGAGLCTEADRPTDVLQNFASSCNGRFRESVGQLELVIMHNDLAGASSDPGLTDDDVIGAFVWNSDPALEQTYNIVRGRYTDPSNASLYQLVDYPEISLTSTDGIDRILQLDLPWVQDAAMAQRIAKQTLERKQYQRSFSAPFGERAAQYSVGDVVPLTFSPLGFSRRLFRVDTAPVSFDGNYNMVLIEENDAIYQWDADDRAPVTPAAPISYSPLNDPILVALNLSRLVPRGAWSSGTSYDFGDSVTFSGSTYRCILAHTASGGNQPPNGTYWVLVAQAGTNGTNGTNGSNGSNGSNGASGIVVRIFRRSATTLTSSDLPSATVTYNFSTGGISGLNNGWTASVPAADGTPLYESAATASSTSSSDTIASTEWAAPILSTGAGVNTFSVIVYKRSASAPAKPSGITTYTFSTGIVSGLDATWSTTPPAYNGNPLYYTTGTALSTSDSDTIPSTEWATPQIMAQDGAAGTGGGGAVAVTPITGTISTGSTTPSIVTANQPYSMPPGNTQIILDGLITSSGTGTADINVYADYSTDPAFGSYSSLGPFFVTMSGADSESPSIETTYNNSTGVKQVLYWRSRTTKSSSALTITIKMTLQVGGSA